MAFAVAGKVASMVVAAVDNQQHQIHLQLQQQHDRSSGRRSTTSAAEKIAALSARVDRLEARLAFTWRVAGGVAACAVLYRFMSHILIASALGFLAWQAFACRHTAVTVTTSTATAAAAS